MNGTTDRATDRTIPHAPGRMFIMDAHDEQYRVA